MAISEHHRAIPVEAVAFLAAVLVFVLLLILFFLYLNKSLCFAECGGFPCIDKIPQKDSTLAPTICIEAVSNSSYQVPGVSAPAGQTLLVPAANATVTRAPVNAADRNQRKVHDRAQRTDKLDCAYVNAGYEYSPSVRGKDPVGDLWRQLQFYKY